MLNDEKVMFRVGLPPKTGPVSRPPPRPSAAIGAHQRPSAACGWVLSVGTGLPPQTPPDFLFVIYKAEVVGVVYCSRAPEESADYAELRMAADGRRPKAAESVIIYNVCCGGCSN